MVVAAVLVIVALALAGCSRTACDQCHGKAEAAGPFRTWHANTRRRSPQAMDRRRASRAKPCPAPRPRPCATCCGLPRVAAMCCVPLRAAVACPRPPCLSARGRHCPARPCSPRTVDREVGVVGLGRAWRARRGGHLTPGTVVRRVFARQVLNIPAASASPPRSQHVRSPETANRQPPTTNHQSPTTKQSDAQPRPLNPAAGPASAPRPSPRRRCRRPGPPARHRPRHACGGATARCGLRSSPASPAGRR
jgi:hypothetical protein